MADVRKATLFMSLLLSALTGVPYVHGAVEWLAPVRLAPGMVSVGVSVKGTLSNAPYLQLKLIVADQATAASPIEAPPDSGVWLAELVVPKIEAKDATLQLYTCTSTAAGSCTVQESLATSITSVGSHKVFVEADKPLYQPGQSVRVRTLCITRDLKPCAFEATAQLELRNPKGSLIDQKEQALPANGVVAWPELPLSAYSELGEYQITSRIVTAGSEESQTVSVEVDEYVLPKFEVIIMPEGESVAAEQASVRGTLIATYTFGQPVQGRADVTLTCSGWYYEVPSRSFGGLELAVAPTTMPKPPEGSQVTLKDLELQDGRLDFTFEQSKDQLNAMGCHSSVYLTAVVTEAGTGAKQEGVASLSMSETPQRFTLMYRGDESYTPGLPLTLAFEAVPKEPGDASLLQNAVLQVSLYHASYTSGKYSPFGASSEEAFDLPFAGGGAATTITPASLNPPCLDALLSGKTIERYNTICPSEISVNAYLRFGTGSGASSGSGGVMSSLSVSEGPSNSEYYYASACLQPEVSEHPVRVQISDPVQQLPINIPQGSQSASVALTVYSLSKPTGPVQLLTGYRGHLASSLKVPAAKFTLVNGAYWAADVQVAVPAAAFPRALFLLLSNNAAAAHTIEAELAEQQLPGSVALSLSAEVVEPGAPMSVGVTVEEDGTVFVLAVDRSVALLRETETRVSERALLALFEDESVTPPDYSPCPFVRAASVLELDASILPPCLASSMPSFCTNQYGCEGCEEAPVMMEAMGDGAVAEAPAAAKGSDVEVRKNFPESWIWEAVTTSGGSGSLDGVKAPDTITSWDLYAFLSADSGYGVAPSGTSLTVFKPIFVQWSLPYKLVMGEVAEVVVSVFHYSDSESGSQAGAVDLDVEVPSGDFQWGSPDNGDLKQGSVSRTLEQVAPRSSKSFKLLISPTALGSLKLNAVVKGSVCNGVCDAVERVVLVEAPGQPTFFTATKLLEPGQTREYSLPAVGAGYVDGSFRAEFRVTGDVMGPTMSNIGSLIRMPYGCGEQNMLNLAPNIAVFDYLKTAGRDFPTSADRDFALRTMREGYQRELTYMHSNGGFSAFGESGGSPASTWLSAFVLKTFAEASQYIAIDNSVMASAASFLLSSQSVDGSFAVQGEVMHTDMMGGAGVTKDQHGDAVTAYTCLALVTTKINLPKTTTSKVNLGNGIAECLSYLNKEYVAREPDAKSRYIYLLSAYATIQASNAQLYSTDAVPGVIDAIKRIGIDETGADGAVTCYLKKGSNSCNPDPVQIESGDAFDMPYTYAPPTAAIEMTGYALLALTAAGQPIAATMPVANYLLTQRSALGGYSSTQDTVVAVAALADYAAQVVSGNTSVAVSVKGDRVDAVAFDRVRADNLLLLQTQQLRWSGDALPETVTATTAAAGAGSVLGTLFATWNVQGPEASGSDSAYAVATELVEDVTAAGTHTGYRYRYHIAPGTSEASGMVVASVRPHSGMRTTLGALAEVQKDCEQVTKVETKAGGALAIYLSSLPEAGCRFELTFAEETPVRSRAPVYSEVYSYYDPAQSSTVTVRWPSDMQKNVVKDGEGSGAAGSWGFRAVSLALCVVAMLVVSQCAGCK